MYVDGRMVGPRQFERPFEVGHFEGAVWALEALMMASADPRARHRRRHKLANVLDKLPKRLPQEPRRRPVRRRRWSRATARGRSEGVAVYVDGAPAPMAGNHGAGAD